MTMFGRKKGSDEATTETELSAESLVAPGKGVRPATPSVAMPTPPARVPNLPPRPAATDLSRPGELGRPAGMVEPPRFGDLPRAPVEPARAVIAPVEPVRRASEPPKPEAEIRQLIVGREISLSGEITACDRLVVEGSVEANLTNCRDVDIAASGLFKGSASIDEAEIRGRFEGTLTVKKRLLIRSTGRVVGTIRYGQVEIECGGEISGDIQMVREPSEAAPAASAMVVEVGAARAS